MTMTKYLSFFACITVFCSLLPLPLFADSWEVPRTIAYISHNGQVRVTISPGDDEERFSSVGDKAGYADVADQTGGRRRVAEARMERLVNGRWQLIWQRPIVNDVAPASAIVRDDGMYLVTFDDWYGTGFGPNVVVIYGPEGQFLRAFSLSDIVPEGYGKALPRSVNSVVWRDSPSFSSDGLGVVIPIVIPSFDSREFVELSIDLSDGRIFPVDPAAWEAALMVGQEVLAEIVAAEEARKAEFLSPLLGSAIGTKREWHHYLQEAFWRLVGSDETVRTVVLGAPDADDYTLSKRVILGELKASYADKVAIASLSESNLVSVLEELALKLPAQSLSKVTVFLALSDQYWPSAVAVMRRSGARLVQIDPTKQIPQRQERVIKYYAR